MIADAAGVLPANAAALVARTPASVVGKAVQGSGLMNAAPGEPSADEASDATTVRADARCGDAAAVWSSETE